MSTTLITRADLRAAFYTLLNSSATDEALAENYTDAVEAANRYIQQGVESAQLHVIEYIDPMRWFARTGPLVWVLDPVTGEHTHPLPDDFLRLSGDRDGGWSAIIESTNSWPWGREIDPRDRHRLRGWSGYYLRGDQIIILPDATPPNQATLEYHYTHPLLTDDDDQDIEFLHPERWLIVAFAGNHAVMDAWPAIGADGIARVEKTLKYWKREIGARGRRSRAPRSFRGSRHVGPNLILGTR